uniref:Fibroblast growth factor binding protein 2a n=1 Tax=Scleropages formosus TaxID=113540 RepID=A0A8C9WIX2_SCLFO
MCSECRVRRKFLQLLLQGSTHQSLQQELHSFYFVTLYNVLIRRFLACFQLNVSCKSANKEYSCEFLGRPQACRSYNNNPKHYFTQIMWELRKLANACEGPRALKPLMCKRATDEAQMVLDTTGPNVETQKPGKANHERQPARGRTEAPKVGAYRGGSWPGFRNFFLSMEELQRIAQQTGGKTVMVIARELGLSQSIISIIFEDKKRWVRCIKCILTYDRFIGT